MIITYKAYDLALPKCGIGLYLSSLLNCLMKTNTVLPLSDQMPHPELFQSIKVFVTVDLLLHVFLTSEEVLLLGGKRQ